MALWNEKPTPAPAGSQGSDDTRAGGAAPACRRRRRRSAARTKRRWVQRRTGPRPGNARRRRVRDCRQPVIEGKIEGSGNVRMAGRFKGDVRIDGNFNIDAGRPSDGPGAGGASSWSAANCRAISNRRSAWMCSRAESSSATSRPDRSRWRPARACAATSNSAGTTRRTVKLAGSRERRQLGASMSVVRQGTLGATRTCPHCKATVLQSANICPGCQHHLRFNVPQTPSRSPKGRRRCASKARSITRAAARPANTAW